MMNKDEIELRDILKSFVKKPQNLDVFVLRLLDIKSWHLTDKIRTHHTLNTPLEPLTKTLAQNTIARLCQSLQEAETLFRLLNAGTMPQLDPPKSVITSTKDEIRIIRIAKNRFLSTEGRNVATDMAPEILNWLRRETENAALQLVKGQKTPKRIREFDVFFLALTCQSVGIKCAYSEDSPFHRLVSWLLGVGDHRRIIKKIMEQYPYLKDKKHKIS